MVKPPRRRTVVVSGLALLAAAAVVVAVRRTDSELIRAAGWGKVAEYRVWDPVASWLPGVRVPRTRTIHFGEDSAWAVTERSPTIDPLDGVTLAGSCTCRFAAQFVDGTRKDTMLRGWMLPPDEPTVTIHAVDAAREQSVQLERPSPGGAGAVAPDRPILALPWSGEVSGVSIELSDGGGTVGLRYSSQPARSVSAWARDSRGRTRAFPRTMPPFGLNADLGFGTDLCPHGPWWEIVVANPGGEPTVLRFACPKAAATPATSK